jgi:hypothetical protein
VRGIFGTFAASSAFTILLLVAPAPEAKAQGAIGFQPNITPFGDSVFLNAQPVVTADRRYVRLGGINASFNALQGVQPFTFPAGAVAGGGVVGGGGFGGFGGFGGPGFNSIAAFGGPGGAAVVPGLGAVAPVGFGWGYPMGFGGYPYAYASPYPVTAFPRAPLYTGPMWMPPQTINTLVPTGWSIMNAVEPGSWRYGPR